MKTNLNEELKCMERREQLQEQLLRGISSMCDARESCEDCPFYTTSCVFGEPKPATWIDSLDEDAIEIVPAPVHVTTPSKDAAQEEAAKEESTNEEPEEEKSEEPSAPASETPKADDDSEGTWLMSTTMGSAFTKYVFICSKCGFRKESYFSIAPTSYCPECEKRKKEHSEN